MALASAPLTAAHEAESWAPRAGFTSQDQGKTGVRGHPRAQQVQSWEGCDAKEGKWAWGKVGRKRSSGLAACKGQESAMNPRERHRVRCWQGGAGSKSRVLKRVKGGRGSERCGSREGREEARA